MKIKFDKDLEFWFFGVFLYNVCDLKGKLKLQKRTKYGNLRTIKTLKYFDGKQRKKAIEIFEEIVKKDLEKEFLKYFES